MAGFPASLSAHVWVYLVVLPSWFLREYALGRGRCVPFALFLDRALHLLGLFLGRRRGWVGGLADGAEKALGAALGLRRRLHRTDTGCPFRHALVGGRAEIDHTGRIARRFRSRSGSVVRVFASSAAGVPAPVQPPQRFVVAGRSRGCAAGTSRMIGADFVDLALGHFAGLALGPPCFKVNDLGVDCRSSAPSAFSSE